MNKNVSLAIEKAVSNLDKIENNDLKELNNNKPDLFSLSHQTELFQNDKVSGVQEKYPHRSSISPET